MKSTGNEIEWTRRTRTLAYEQKPIFILHQTINNKRPLRAGIGVHDWGIITQYMYIILKHNQCNHSSIFMAVTVATTTIIITYLYCDNPIRMSTNQNRLHFASNSEAKTRREKPQDQKSPLLRFQQQSKDAEKRKQQWGSAYVLPNWQDPDAREREHETKPGKAMVYLPYRKHLAEAEQSRESTRPLDNLFSTTT